MSSHRIGGLVRVAINVFLATACHDNAPSEAPPETPKSNVITTVAGGRLAFSGDGGPSLDARLNGPAGVAIDRSGNLYVADALNQRVRMVDASGRISTVAGDGVAGITGDGGPAKAAKLSNPVAVAVSSSGDVYIADAGNHRVRRITPTGTMTTVAGDGRAGFSGDGGSAASAQLDTPMAVAVDGSGNIYIADAGNNRVRRIDAAGIIGTVAGNGTAGSMGDAGPATQAQLRGPIGVAVDASGNLYIADEGNSRIRRVSAAGVITTLAGTGTAGFTGDGGPATLAALNRARAVAVDRTGNVYVSDTRSIRVRRIAPDGIITTVVGNGTRGFSGDGGPATAAQIRAPHGLAIDSAGNVLVADYGNNQIRRVDGRGVITRFAGSATDGSGDGGQATQADLAHPRSVAAGPAGTFYISDWNNNRVWRVTRDGIITTLAGTRTAGFSGDGGPAVDAELTAPHGIAADAAGNVYIADQNNSRVRRVGTDGIIKTIAGDGRLGVAGDGGAAVSAAVGLPSAVALDAAGNLYISQQSSHVIRRVSTSGIITTIAGIGTPGFSGDGGPATQARLNFPIGIASDSAGNVYVAEQSNNRVRRIGVDGIITTVIGNGSLGSTGDGGPATDATMSSPFGVAVDRTGNVYVTDSRNNRIRRVGRDGVIVTVAGNGVPGFSGDGGPPTGAQLQGPHGVVVDADGTVLIADTANDRIRRVSVE
jgi:sugar lactone lactonase YvrE